MRTSILALLAVVACNKQTEPAKPTASLIYRTARNEIQSLGPVALADRPFGISSGWSGECTAWEIEHLPIGRRGRQTCDRRKFALSATCEPECLVTVDGHRASILPGALGLHRIVATLTGPTVATIELGVVVVPVRAILIDGCIVAQQRERMIATSGARCRVNARGAIGFSLVGSNIPITNLDGYYAAGTAMRALGERPDYKALAAYTGPLARLVGSDQVRVNGRPVGSIEAANLGPPGDYPVTLEYKDVRAEIVLEVLPPDLGP